MSETEEVLYKDLHWWKRFTEFFKVQCLGCKYPDCDHFYMIKMVHTNHKPKTNPPNIRSCVEPPQVESCVVTPQFKSQGYLPPAGRPTEAEDCAIRSEESSKVFKDAKS